MIPLNYPFPGHHKISLRRRRDRRCAHWFRNPGIAWRYCFFLRGNFSAAPNIFEANEFYGKYAIIISQLRRKIAASVRYVRINYDDTTI